MGFFDKIFGRPKDSGAQQARQTFDFLEGYTPAWHTFKGSIYESELIRAALDAHGRHAAKLTPVINGAASPSLRNRLMLQPNVWQTWPKFLYRLAVTLYARNTAFIVPVLGEYGETNGIIGVVPHSWELVEYKGEPYLRFRLAKNKTVAIELYRVGILTRYQYENEIFGASNDAMRPTLDLIAIQRQGITEGIKTTRIINSMPDRVISAKIATWQMNGNVSTLRIFAAIPAGSCFSRTRTRISIR